MNDAVPQKSAHRTAINNISILKARNRLLHQHREVAIHTRIQYFFTASGLHVCPKQVGPGHIHGMTAKCQMIGPNPAIVIITKCNEFTLGHPDSTIP